MFHDEQCDLILRRAHPVPACFFKAGKVAGERLFLASPTTVPGPGKGETRGNLALNESLVVRRQLPSINSLLVETNTSVYAALGDDE